MGRYHNIPSNNSNNDKSNSQLHFSELASLHKDNSRMTSIDFSKPLFGNKHTSLQKLLAKANKTTERATKFINKIKSRQVACANRAKSIPENATIRKEYIKCGKQMCELRHGPYYYAYWKDPESKKLKKRYAGDYMPKNKESNDSAISDPKLLADRLPDTRQQEIFDYAKIKEFVSTMLRQPVWLDSNHDKFDARRTRLAAIMAEESLKKCIDQYKNKIEKSEVLSKQNVSLLENAISLCNEISIRVQWLETESKTKE